MTSNESMRDRVANWLVEQGYPLEMRVASALRRSEFWVRQSTHYIDPETGKSREIDVIATEAEPLGMAEIHFVVECKATSKPWVLFTSPHTLNNFNHLFALGISSDGARGTLAQKIEALAAELPWFRKDGRVGYNLTEAFTTGGDNAYSAAIGAVKACMFLLQSTERSHTPPLIFTFPAIVIQSPLVECFLDESGKMSVAEIDQGWLFFNTWIPGFSGTCLRVVSQAALERFSSEIRGMKNSLQRLIAPDVEREWQAFKKEFQYPK